MKRTNKKVCIIGSAPSKKDAPYGDLSFDIWAVSGAIYSESYNGVVKPNTPENSWNDVYRLDVLFEMHKRKVFDAKMRELAKSRFPIIMQNKERDIPKSEEYPIDEITSALGCEDYSSSIAYMLAYAIYLGYEEIRIYGVLMLHKTEYVRQRAGVKFYLGYAQAKGIKVYTPNDSGLTRSLWRYGYDDHDAICGMIAERKASLDDDLAKQEKVIADARAAYFQLRGASIDCEENMILIKEGLA